MDKTNIKIKHTNHETQAGIKIINIAGQEIQNKSIKISKGVNQFELDFSELTSGVYFIIIQLDDGTRYSNKIIRQ